MNESRSKYHDETFGENINPGRGSVVMECIILVATEHLINSYPS